MDKNNIKKQNVYISEEERTLDWIEIQSSFKKTFGTEKLSNEALIFYGICFFILFFSM